MTFLFLSHFCSLSVVNALGRVIATKSLRVKCLFFQWSQNIKSVYTECKQIFPREYQTSLCYANRQLHSTNNILGAKACEQRGLGALTQSGLTCSLSAHLKASSKSHTTRRKASINYQIAKINTINLSLFFILKDDHPLKRHLTLSLSLFPSAAMDSEEKKKMRKQRLIWVLLQRKQCGNFRRVSGLHKGNTHTGAGPNVCIKEAWRIGLRLNYGLMLREALFFLWKKRITERETKSESLTERDGHRETSMKSKTKRAAVEMLCWNSNGLRQFC